MPNHITEANYGTYLLVTRAYKEPASGMSWKDDEIAMVFSHKRKRHADDIKSRKFDLLFENGRTVFGVPGELLISCFHMVYQDPDTIIDGCSTNFGWREARKRISSVDTD